MTPGSTPSTQAGQPPVRLTLPYVLGGYELREVISRGGAATVYRAVAADGEAVAVKVLHTRIHEPGVRARFEREASIRIDHPNVVQVRGAGVSEDGLAWLAFELLQGEPLARRIARSLLTAREAVRLGLDAAAGLRAAHARGIVHRDLKPENLFLCEDGTLKVLDFGIALHQDRGTRLTTTGVVLGTPWYLAPEQARGVDRLDHRVDVWALGAVLYEGLCGKAPFERDTPLATVVAIVHDELQPLRERAPHVPASLAAVVDTCLEKDPARRWPSMEALQAALEQIDPRDLETEERASLPPLRPGEAALGAVLWVQLGPQGDEQRAEAIVAQWGGSWVRLEDGSTMAFFGGERARGDEVRRAAEAALRLNAERTAISLDRIEAFRATLRGPALDRARQLALDGAEQGAIVVDPRAAPLLTARFVLEARGERWLLLERKPTTSHPPVARPTPSRRTQRAMAAIHTLPLGREPPLVGRAVEVARLREAVERLLEEQRALGLLLEGPPGIGKRRLRRELRRMLHDEDEPVLVLRASAEGVVGHRAFGLFAEALRRRAQQGAARDGWPSLGTSAPVSERVEALGCLVDEALGSRVPDREHLVACLGELLQVPVHDDEPLRSARSEPRALTEQLRSTLDRLLEGWLGQRPVALLFDHLQWADSASLEAFEGFLERFADRPLLLAGTVRPELFERRPGWLDGLPVERIRLKGLSRRHVERLAASVAGRPLPATFVQTLHEHTGGVPLFVEQIVAALRAQGRLNDVGERLETLPLTVEAAVQAHLDALPELLRRLCQRVAWLQRPFDPPLVEALGVAAPVRLLEQGRARGLLEARPGPDGHRLYRLRSPLLAQVARRSLDATQRQHFARRAAEALADRPDRDVFEIARLRQVAGQPELAAQAFAQAALEPARPAELVVEAAAQALTLGRIDATLRARVALAQATALGLLGRHTERVELLAREAERAADPVLLAAMDVDRAGALARLGRLEEAFTLLEDVTRRPGIDDRLRGRAWLWTAQMHVFEEGRLEPAETALQQARHWLRDRSWELGLLASTEGHLHVLSGRLDRAVEAFAEASRLLAAAGDLGRRCNASSNRAAALNDLGAYEEAVVELRETLEVSTRLGLLEVRAYAQANLAYALGRLGRGRQAEEAIAEALAFAERRADPRLLGLTTFYYFCIAVHTGPHEGAHLSALARDGLRRARRLQAAGEERHAALCRAVAGRALLEAGRPLLGSMLLGTVGEHPGRASGAPAEDIEVRVHLARALQACGRTEQAERIWREAAQELRARLDRLQSPHYRTTFLERVEAHALLTRHPAWSASEGDEGGA